MFCDVLWTCVYGYGYNGGGEFGLWVWEVVLLEVYAAVGELAERSLLLDLGSLSCVLCAKTCQFVVPLKWLRSIERHWGCRLALTYSSSAMIAVYRRELSAIVVDEEVAEMGSHFSIFREAGGS